MSDKNRFVLGRASGHPLRTKTALEERLKDIVLLELRSDGGREFHTMTLRGLYDYVIRTIVTAGRNRHDKEISQLLTAHLTDARGSPGTLTRSRQASIGSLEEMPPLPPIAKQHPARHKSLPSIPERRATVQPELIPSSQGASSMGGTTDDLFASCSDNPNYHDNTHLEGNANARAAEKKVSSRSILTADHEIPHPVVTIRERLGGYLHPRDMRRLVTPFSASNEPELMVRRHVMLLNFDPLRAIVLRDRLLVLVPDGADSILISLEKRVRGGIDEMEKQVFGDETSSHLSEVYNPETKEVELVPSSVIDGLDVVDNYESGVDRSKAGKGQEERLDSDLSMDHEGSDGDDNGDNNVRQDDDSTTTVYSDDNMENEWDEFEGKDWIEMTFELQSVDAVLSSVVKMLSEESLHLRKQIFSVMEELRGDSVSAIPGDHIQEQLRVLKDKVREMEGRVQGFIRAMNQILDEEEDMALMNLSRLISHPERFIQPVPRQVLTEESDEPELILEVYLQQALSEMNALVLLKGNILNTEELVSLQMDTIRNRLLYINTVVSAMSLCVACGSLVGSIFGMNLINHRESSPNTFAAVVAGTLVGMVLLLIGILVLISRAGVMPANPRKALYSKKGLIRVQ